MGKGTIGVELYAHLPVIFSLCVRDAVHVSLTEKIPEYFHHPKTWVHVRVPLIIHLLLLSQVLPA